MLVLMAKSAFCHYLKKSLTCKMMDDEALDSWTVLKKMPLLGYYGMPVSEALSKASVYLRNMEKHSDDLDTGEVNLLEHVNSQALVKPYYIHFEELEMPRMPASKIIYKAATFALGSFNQDFFQIVYLDIKSKQSPEKLFNILKSLLKVLKDAGKIHNLLAIIVDRNETNAQLANCDVPTLWDRRQFNRNNAVLADAGRLFYIVNFAYSNDFHKDTYNTEFQKCILDMSLPRNEEVLADLKTLNQIVEKLFLYAPDAPKIQLGFCNNERLKSVGYRWRAHLKDFLKSEKRAVNEIEREFPKIFPRVLGILAHFEEEQDEVHSDEPAF